MPANYDAAVPAPLLIVLHGYGSFGAETADYLGLDPYAEANGFLTAYPEGTADPGGINTGTTRQDDTAASGVDDAAYLSGLVAEVADTANVDPDRVFAMGHSNGAFMAYRMACDHADVFAAAVSLAGATLETADECQAAGPIAVLEIHGDRDDVVLLRRRDPGHRQRLPIGRGHRFPLAGRQRMRAGHARTRPSRSTSTGCSPVPRRWYRHRPDATRAGTSRCGPLSAGGTSPTCRRRSPRR